MKKICFISSSGGHFEQLLMLNELMIKYDSFIVTENTSFSAKLDDKRIYYLNQVNRREYDFLIKLFFNSIKSLKIFIKEKPDVVISTGAMISIPMCLLSKIFKKKLIFIESFSKINSPTITGKIIYKFADEFYVQWESMKEFYPNAICKGGIY